MSSGALKDYLGVGLASARPTTLSLAPGVAGYYFATDTAAMSVWTGSAWVSISSGGGGALAVKQAGSTIVSSASAINFASGATVTATGSQADVTAMGGGGSSWMLLNSWDFSVSGAITQLDTTGLTVDEVMIITDGLTKASATATSVRVSDNNGASYYSTNGNYASSSSSGTSSSKAGFDFADGTTSATSNQMIITGLKNTAEKINYGSTSNVSFRFVASASTINAVRVVGSLSVNFTGGKIWVYGR